jgi:hypothetical protein
MQFKHLAATSVAVAALGLSLSASASIVNFDQQDAQSPTGTISYAGDGGALVGSGISFDRISLNGATAPTGHQGSLTCMSCSIAFTTGNNTGEGTSTGIWSFAGGGNFQLNGTAKDSGGNTVASGLLFGGTFGDSPQIVVRTGTASLSANLSGSDDFNADLANYFGLASGPHFAFSNTEISLGSATFGGDGSFNSGKLTNADVSVQSAGPAKNVPEPAELGLFAIGLALLLGGLGFRRKQGGDIA